MNNNIDKEDNELLHYSSFSGWNLGSNTAYSITKDGKIKLTLECGVASPNPVITTIEEKLSKDEMDMIQEFINSEITGKNYESEFITDVSYKIIADGREFDNCLDLNQKFGKILNKVLENHYVLSSDVIDLIFTKHKLQEDERMKNDPTIAAMLEENQQGKHDTLDNLRMK